MANEQYVEEVYQMLTEAYGNQVGDKAKFSEKMKDEEYRKDMHENLEFYYKEKAPDFTTFEKNYNSDVKKKDLSQGSASDSGVSTSTVQSESGNKVTPPPVTENPTTITDNGSGVDYSAIYGGDKAVTQVNLPQGITDDEITKRIEFEQSKQQPISEDVSGQGVVSTDGLSSSTPVSPVVKTTVTPKTQQFTPNPNLGNSISSIKLGFKEDKSKYRFKEQSFSDGINKAVAVKEIQKKIKEQQGTKGKKLPEPTFETSTAVKDFNLTQDQWEASQKAYNIYNKTIGAKGGKQYAKFDEFAHEYHKQKVRELEDAKIIESQRLPLGAPSYAALADQGKIIVQEQAVKRERQYDDITSRYTPQFEQGLNNIQEIASKANSGDREAIQQLEVYNKYLKDVENVKNYAVKNNISENVVTPILNGLKNKYTVEMFPAVNTDWNNVLLEDRKKTGTFGRATYYGMGVVESQPVYSAFKMQIGQEYNKLTDKQKSLMPDQEVMQNIIPESSYDVDFNLFDKALRMAIEVTTDPSLWLTGGLGNGVV